MFVSTPEISVIIPVYNAEKYLSRCIDSILAQSFTNFELLLVDDGSKDKSGEICDNYATKDSRIRVFHQKNSGAMSARAFGVKQSRLDGYVTFVDADDELPTSALEAMAEYCSETFDIIIGRYDNNSYPISELTKEDNRLCAITGVGLRCSPWGRLIKRRLFDDWTFNIPREIIRGEDMLMNIRLAFKNQKSVKLVSKKVYNYSLDNEDSIIHTFKNTIEYEEMFSKYRLLSIPTELRNHYIKEIISSQVNGVVGIINTTRQECSKYQYVQTLIKEIKKNRIHVPFFSKLKLYSSSNFTLGIVFFIEDVKNKIKKFL